MNKFFIYEKQNNIPMHTNYELDNNVLDIQKIHFELNNFKKSLVFNVFHFLGTSDEIHTNNFEYTIDFEGNSSISKGIAFQQIADLYTLNLNIEINETIVTIENIQVIDPLVAIKNRINKFKFKGMTILLEGRTLATVSSVNLQHAKVSFGLISHKFYKIYLNNSLPTTIEIKDNNQAYTNLLSVKATKEYPIEFNNEDFMHTSSLNNNSFLTITNEDNQIVDIKFIIIFYNII